MAPNRYYSSAAQPGTLAASMTASQTTLQITASPASLGWPTSYPYTLLLDWGTSKNEVVTITQAATGTGPYTFANVTRGADGTTGVTHTAPQNVYHGTSAQDDAEPQIHMGATGPTTNPTTGGAVPVHGIGSGSAVVGTTDTQTLTGKTLSGAAFTGGTSGLLDTTAADITVPVLQSTGRVAGSNGLAADSGHTHPMTTDTWHTLSNPTNISGLFRVTLLAAIFAVWFDIEVTVSVSGAATYTFGAMPNSGYYPNSTTWPNGRHMPVALTGAPTGVASNLPRLFIPTSGGPQLLIPAMAASGDAIGASVLVPLG